jgi:hypothetical protein
MLNYIMIIIFTAPGLLVLEIDFHTKEACNTALKEIREEIKGEANKNAFNGVCVDRGLRNSPRLEFDI